MGKKENQPLARLSNLSSGTPEKSALIKEWLVTFALNAGKVLNSEELAVYEALWMRGFSDLSYQILEAAFVLTLREKKYWPIQVADVREHLERTNQMALTEKAALAWEKALEYRRRFVDFDKPGGLSSQAPQLSGRFGAACRASGVLREVSDPDDLHKWGKKRFLESYIAWTTLGKDNYLLPEGEIKNLLQRAAQEKSLPQIEYRDPPGDEAA